MFSKSRKKIILSIMGSLIILFAVTFAVIMFASFSEIRHKNLEMLKGYAEEYSLDHRPSTQAKLEPAFEDKSRPGDPPINKRRDYQLSTFYAVAISNNGSVLDVDNGEIVVYNKEKLVSIAKNIVTKDRGHGRSDNLTYVVSKKKGYTLVAFMDNTVSEAGLKTMLRYVLIVGLVAIIIMFFVSLFVSKKIIRPLEENDKRQKQFISDASHELKTPIAVIDTNAEMLSREIGNNEWLSNIRYENDRMGVLVKQLLDLSHAESAIIPMEDLDFSRIVTGEVLAFEIIAFENGKEILTKIEDKITLTGNKSQLTQVISILLDNALRHSTGKQIEVTLNQHNHMVKLSVVNDGHEIPQDKMDHLFDRFYRIDEARNSQGQHYGIGLSIAKAVVEGHKGSIEASCQDGKISFTVALPKNKKIKN